MLEFLKKQANLTRTENGASTYVSTCSFCLDLFATIGALRREPEDEIRARFLSAYAEDPDLAMKILFFARDVRGGLGERRVFRVLLRWLAENEPASLERNLPFIAEFGRFDDLLCLMDSPCEKTVLAYIKEQLAADLAALERGDSVSLLAKWLPSVNASNRDTVSLAKRIARSLGMKDADYRRTLVRLRGHIRILENHLREKDYSFDYASQPSKALFKYRRAFQRNDAERYHTFLEQVAAGETEMHTGTLTPYEIIAPFFAPREITEEERRAINVTWNAQEDFTSGENALVVVDGSGSMYWGEAPLPAAVAQSLAIYFAQRNTGVFHDHFITFSTTPRLVQLKGRDLLEQFRYCASFNECCNTNLQKIFELILTTALRNRLPQSELPSTLYIISDMEFDHCVENASLTIFEYAKALYARHGYTLPRVVFWNVSSRNRQQPVTQNEQGVALVSGCSPRIFAMLKSGALDPYSFMMETLNTERYAKIAA